MAVAGIVAEYNPLHGGHLGQLEQTRARLGADTAAVCVMSGDFVQRGDFALLGRHARAEAAVRSGADLVVELPLPWAAASAERFADGAVQALAATGVVTHLSFGSECGDAPALRRAAAALEDSAFPPLLREELAAGDSFAAARQRALARLAGQDASVLDHPNDILGVEYCRCLVRRRWEAEVLAIPRQGAAHDGEEQDGTASAAAIRGLLAAGERQRALDCMAPAMAAIFFREEAAGRAPVFAANCQRAILARLRGMSDGELEALDTGGEGLGNRFRAAVRTAPTLAVLLESARTKRYAAARIRRMALWGYLGLRPAQLPSQLPYLRVLAANERGRALLARMRRTASLPVVTKPASVRRLPAPARELFAMEARAADLYALAYPDLAAAAGGAAWTTGPVMV